MRVTKSVRRGIGAVLSLIEVNHSSGTGDLFVGCETNKDYQDIDNAVAWLYDLVNRKLHSQKGRSHVRRLRTRLADHS